MDSQGHLKTTDLFWGHKVIKEKIKEFPPSFTGRLFICIYTVHLL